jgi:hypothetical protein
MGSANASDSTRRSDVHPGVRSPALQHHWSTTEMPVWFTRCPAGNPGLPVEGLKYSRRAR